MLLLICKAMGELEKKCQMSALLARPKETSFPRVFLQKRALLMAEG